MPTLRTGPHIERGQWFKSWPDLVAKSSFRLALPTSLCGLSPQHQAVTQTLVWQGSGRQERTGSEVIELDYAVNLLDLTTLFK